jgi:hypothetical protein
MSRHPAWTLAVAAHAPAAFLLTNRMFSPPSLLALMGWLLLAASRGRDYASPS